MARDSSNEPGRAAAMKARLPLLAAVAIGAAAAWLVAGAATGPRLGYQIGDRVRVEVVAPEPLTVVDAEKTEALRAEAAARVAPVFDLDPEAQTRAVEAVRSALSRLGTEFETASRAARPPEAAAFAEARASEFPYGGAGLVELFARHEFEPRLVSSVVRVLERRLPGYIIGDDVAPSDQVTVRNVRTGEAYPVFFRDLTRLSDAKKALRGDLAAIDGFNGQEHRELGDAFEPLVATTLRPNPAETEAARARARDGVAEVRDEYARGDVVAHRNQVVDDRVAAALAAVDRLRATPDRLSRWAGVSLLVWALLYVIWRVAGAAACGNLDAGRAFLLSALALLAQVGLDRLGVEAAIRIGALAAFDGQQAQYLLAIPFAVAPLVVALLTTRTLGFVVGLAAVPLVAFLTAGLPGGGLAVAVFAAIVSVVAVAAAAHYRARHVAALAAVWLAAGAAPALLAGGLASGPAPAAGIGLHAANLGLACLGAVFTAALAAILLPAVEWAFDILSDVRLLELASADRPALRELAIRAPGTHQHS